MKRYLEEMREAKEKGQIGHISDANFHFSISYGTHNVMLIHLMKNLFYWIEKVSYEVRSRMYTNSESHEALLNSIPIFLMLFPPEIRSGLMMLC